MIPIIVPTFYSSRQKREQEEKGFANCNSWGCKEEAMPNVTCTARVHNKEIQFSFSPELFKDEPELCMQMVKEQFEKIITQALEK